MVFFICTNFLPQIQIFLVICTDFVLDHIDRSEVASGAAEKASRKARLNQHNNNLILNLPITECLMGSTEAGPNQQNANVTLILSIRGCLMDSRDAELNQHNAN